MLYEDVMSVLRDDMLIDITHLFSKINSASMCPYSSDCFGCLARFVSSLNKVNASEAINDIAFQVSESVPNSEFKGFIDSMRHAFISFSKGGMRDLFEYQENQVWYPRILLKEVITPNDIHTLDSVITLYRGCDQSEYISKAFGQSWSTSEEVAREFAFTHYSSQNWFDSGSRCLLTAKIDRDHVYYSNQRKHEREVVVDTEKLRDLEICA